LGGAFDPKPLLGRTVREVGDGPIDRGPLEL